MKKSILHTHKELIEKSKAGDRNSQYKLYELYVDAMYNVSVRIVSIKEDAEDIIQDSFVQAFKNLSFFRYESTFGSWLKRIVVNKSINHLRLKRVSLTLIDHELHITEEDSEIKEFSELEIKKIDRSIQLLPIGYKQILSLYLIEGYDHVEISEILGISVSTSKSQYHRAKKKLIEIMNSL